MKEAIETYRSEKDLHGSASYAKIAKKFDINRVTLPISSKEETAH